MAELLHPLADLHEDWASFKADTGSFDPFLRNRQKTLGTTLPEYNSEGKIVGEVVFSSDVTGLEDGNVGLVLLNSFCDPEKPFNELYSGQQNLYDIATESIDNPLQLIRTAGDLRQLSKDKIAVIYSVEGIYKYDGNIGALLLIMWTRGTRSIGPIWNGDSNFATGHLTGERHGLTPQGKEFIKTADEMGFLIDLSHASRRTSIDILNTVKNRPVIVTHTASRTLVPTTRNIDDDLTVEVVKRGGIIGINFSSWMLEGDSAEERSRADVMSAVRHYEHYRNLFAKNGVKNVLAVGTDSNGLYKTSRVQGLDSIATVGEVLTEGLRKTDFSDTEIAGILGGNATRFFKAHLPK